MRRTPLSQRKLPHYTRGEEIFNMVTHIVGGGLGVAFATLCIIMAALHGNVYGVVSGSIYGGTMIILYTMSSIYHGLSPRLTAKKVFQIFDHCSIYLLIAGTYTPYTLVTVRSHSEWMGWTIFGFVWGCAALGITLTSIDLKKFHKFALCCYLLMGWCILVCVGPTFRALGFWGSFFLLGGGIFYTGGVAFFVVHKPYMHSVFHLFVLMGSLMQFISILFFVMPG